MIISYLWSNTVGDPVSLSCQHAVVHQFSKFRKWVQGEFLINVVDSQFAGMHALMGHG